MIADRPDPSSDSTPQPTIEPDTTTKLPVNGFRDDDGGDRRLHIIARYHAEEIALNGASSDVLQPPTLPFPWLMADQQGTENLEQMD